MRIPFALFVLSFLLCFFPVVRADCVQHVKHFTEAEIPDVERTLNDRVVKITANQGELIWSEIQKRDPRSKNELFSFFRETLNTAERETISYNALSDLTDSTLICHELLNHTDVLIQFQANMRLASTGDTVAAEGVCNLFSDRSLGTFEARVIRTACLETGVNPDKTNPADLLSFLGSLTNSSGFKKGELVDDFETVDTEGKKFKLNDHRGQFVLLHFWATNCGPCMSRMPAIKEKIEQLPSKRIEVLFVSLDFDEIAFDKARKELGIPCRHVYDGQSVGGAIPRQFKVHRMPFDIVIDPDGRFVGNSLDEVVPLLSVEVEGKNTP